MSDLLRMNTALNVSNVSKFYRWQDLPVLSDVTFSVQRGECFALLGMNGAGKTTLIKCLLGLSRQSRGSLEIFDGTTQLPWTRSKLAYVPERFSPPQWLTVRDYLKVASILYAQNWGVNQVSELMLQLGMKLGALELPFNMCSKGMVQKIGLIGALLSGRDLLILDEPMSGLDPFSRAQVKRQLKALKSQDRTLLMCTHSLSDVEEFADRVAVLHEGRLRFIGTPDEWLISTRTESLEEAFLATIGMG